MDFTDLVVIHNNVLINNDLDRNNQFKIINYNNDNINRQNQKQNAQFKYEHNTYEQRPRDGNNVNAQPCRKNTSTMS